MSFMSDDLVINREAPWREGAAKETESAGRRGHVTEDHLDALGAVGSFAGQEFEGPAEFLDACVGAEGVGAAGGAGDAVEVGREGEGPPTHFEKLLVEEFFGVGHHFIVAGMPVFV
jgi:hypothetical protein